LADMRQFRRRFWRRRCRKGAPCRQASSKDARIGIENFTIEIIELQIACDIGAQRTERVRESGGAEAGMKFLGDGATADHFAAFEDEGLKPPLAR